MRQTCLNMVYELAQQDPRIFFIGSDLGAGTLARFKKEMPERFLMEGVSEAHLIGMAAGLALEGKIVYVNTIATFLTRRCFEQIVLDLCLHQVNVRLIGNGGGVVYAPLGPTHLAIDDIAILRAVPHMTIIAPADSNEMKRLMPLTVDYPGPMYIRLAKGHDPIVTRDDAHFKIGKGILMRAGQDALVVTTGVTLGLALQAADELAKESIEVAVLHLPTIKPLDAPMLLNAAIDVPIILTIEEHTILGGLGSSVAEVLMEGNLPARKYFKRLGLPDVFPEGYGSQAGQMQKYGISAARIVEEVRRLRKLEVAEGLKEEAALSEIVEEV